MRILGWTLAGLVALLLGSAFAFLSGSLILSAITAVSVLLITAYLSWEADGTLTVAPGEEASGEESPTTAHDTTYTSTTYEGTPSGGNSNTGEDGGGN